MILLEKARKEYGGKVAVEGLDLEVRPGEILAFLGPNGAGKTTTVKMVAGLLRPTSGRISVFGHDLQREAMKAKALLGYVPDQPFLYDKLSGLEFLAFIGDMYGVPAADRRRETDRLAGLFGMADWLGDLTETYSHGMKQRLVLAATLLHRPKAVLLDEPLVGLDPHSTRLVRGILRDLARDGAAVFMSTHVISIAEDVADRIGIIRDGRLVALGPVGELRRQARTDGRLEEVFFRFTEGGPGASDPPASGLPDPA